ncbi:MAG: Exo-glucosaminidase LytG precursor [Bacteroidetes bacterium ADurb.Bin408]|nr:MAG: Exo-glucosaminidase LytG precursor [Bacteroidetes bacterium ADurb.Bin408]
MYSLVKKFLFGNIFFILIPFINAQVKPNLTIEQYIELYKNTAIEHMKQYHIPASIKLAQGILESSWGNSELAYLANNHFGIKCHKDWIGETFYKDDDTKNECFRKYKHAEESYTDHSLFLTTRNRYAKLFELEITDYKGWAKELKEAGYATNPKYPELLTNLIEKYNLNRFDTVSVVLADIRPGKKPVADTSHVVVNRPVNQVKRQVLLNNRVKYILARKGDTFQGLAKELQMGSWQLCRYNETSKNTSLKEGQIVYLQPKRRRSFEYKEHIVKEGETLYELSQKYGIKTRHLLRLNPEISPDGDIENGQRIRLQKERK